MKIEFPDKSSIEFRKSVEPGKVIILLQAKDHQNELKTTTNSIEITDKQLKFLISDII